ncbi:MAG: hypothetical protein GY863_01910 [bacterium]|nr:hypothetical protein [bacterium]
MSDRSCCNHKNLVYLGIQKIDGFETELTLYNCLDCKSTISVESSKSKTYGRVRNISKEKRARIYSLSS